MNEIKTAAIQNYFADEWQTKLTTELSARKFSMQTIKSYLFYNKDLCNVMRKTPEQITADDIKRYLAYLNNYKRSSVATINLAISAHKFFFTWVMGACVAGEQRRAQEDKTLPVVLDKSEVHNMINGVSNIKHKLLLMLVYSSGLRVSEVVNLKKQDIDITRKTVFIHDAKGRKDRYTLLSDNVIDCFNQYIALREIDNWLFPCPNTDKHITTRTAQKVFEKAQCKANIEKKASIHTLRHSFATHLLEDGTDISSIQQLLGHSSIKTTSKYTHIARNKILQVCSPL